MSDNPKNILSPIPYDEATILVNARAKIYTVTTEIYLPNKPYKKTKSGLEVSVKTKDRNGSPIPTSEEEKLDRSLRRSHTVIKDIFMCNPFELFVTFTFKARRHEVELCRTKMAGWLKRQRKKDKTFQYVIVPEFHKKCEECVDLKNPTCAHADRSKALHFHALIKGYEGEITRTINPKTNKPLVKRRRQVYDFPAYTLGHSEVYFIGDTDEDRLKSGFYLLKYVKKEMPLFANRKRYWSSRGLNKPITIDNPEEWYFALIPDHLIQTEYGKFLFFNNKRIEIFLPWR